MKWWENSIKYRIHRHILKPIVKDKAYIKPWKTILLLVKFYLGINYRTDNKSWMIYDAVLCEYNIYNTSHICNTFYMSTADIKQNNIYWSWPACHIICFGAFYYSEWSHEHNLS